MGLYIFVKNNILIYTILCILVSLIVYHIMYIYDILYV